MSGRKYVTALFGFGRMGAGYAADAKMARYYPYASHAQVLRDHPNFSWRSVVDPDEAALTAARESWAVGETVGALEELADADQIEVAILAVPPSPRAAIVERLPGLKAVLVEKPLGDNNRDAAAFLDLCAQRDIAVQVNLYRRADATMAGLAAGGLTDRIGDVQCVTGIYGNGLANNGTHMIDLVRMLVGEISSVRGLPGKAGDDNPVAIMTTADNVPVVLAPLNFSHFRENGLEITGTHGRFDIMLEGLINQFVPVVPSRYAEGEREWAIDAPEPVVSTVGEAQWAIYEDLARHLAGQGLLASPGESALQTAYVVDAILHSAANAGAPLDVPQRNMA